MQNPNHAIQAYKTASRYRSQRDQEADVFRQVSATLRRSQTAGPIQQIRAIVDNRRLWMMVNDLMRDATNGLPEPLRVAIVSVAMSVMREMDQEAPDVEFLIAVNESIASGLSGQL